MELYLNFPLLLYKKQLLKSKIRNREWMDDQRVLYPFPGNQHFLPELFHSHFLLRGEKEKVGGK